MQAVPLLTQMSRFHERVRRGSVTLASGCWFWNWGTFTKSSCGKFACVVQPVHLVQRAANPVLLCPWPRWSTEKMSLQHPRPVWRIYCSRKVDRWGKSGP
eukprot:4297306-Pyramimonas_sp.AAC.1